MTIDFTLQAVQVAGSKDQKAASAAAEKPPGGATQSPPNFGEQMNGSKQGSNEKGWRKA